MGCTALIDDPKNRATAQETGEELPLDRRDDLKHCLDDVVALLNGWFVEGASSHPDREAEKRSD